MKEKTTLVYQLICIVLLITLICTALCRKCPSTPSPTEPAALSSPAAETPAPQGQDIGNGWRKIAPSEITDNSIDLIGNYKGILAMGNKEEHNAMTIGWGTLGVLWGKPIYTVFVSSSRFSYTLMEKYDTFTVAFFNKSHMKDVMYLGRHSGRDGDKISQTNLHLNYTEAGNPTFDEAFLVIECRKIYASPFDTAKLQPAQKDFYEKRKIGIHTEYVGEILNVFVNEGNRVEK
ncbi:MAG: flavin reductase [Victivallales bacterium]|nr:flavin reductase [Victivallales bacterium]